MQEKTPLYIKYRLSQANSSTMNVRRKQIKVDEQCLRSHDSWMRNKVDEVKGKAAEVTGQAKGKAAELAGEAKGKKEEIKGKL